MLSRLFKQAATKGTLSAQAASNPKSPWKIIPGVLIGGGLGFFVGKNKLVMPGLELALPTKTSNDDKPSPRHLYPINPY